MANRFLAKRATAVALTYAQAQAHLTTRAPALVTGNPVRATLYDAHKTEARTSFNLPQDARVLLIFGGSQGARHINQAVVALALQLLERPTLYVLHITGPRDYSTVLTALANISADLPASARPRWQVIDYCDRMGDAYAAADVVLARSGATSLAELAALGLPSLLVPYPHATDDHQTTNARTLVAAGAALMVADVELDSPVFSQTLARLIDDDDLCASMATAARALGATNATTTIIDMLLKIAVS
jgi:UDP-N-acetylglucosamine--N-acetylmuramyl-(pentapeptide) pyrophosphoryl-undecaprenol N-acetylglucosamine transferase